MSFFPDTSSIPFFGWILQNYQLQSPIVDANTHTSTSAVDLDDNRWLGRDYRLQSAFDTTIYTNMPLLELEGDRIKTLRVHFEELKAFLGDQIEGVSLLTGTRMIFTLSR